MAFLGTLLLFGGYMLVYAATANHGKFATEPWAGLVADAYDRTTPPPASSSTGTGKAP